MGNFKISIIHKVALQMKLKLKVKLKLKLKLKKLKALNSELTCPGDENNPPAQPSCPALGVSFLFNRAGHFRNFGIFSTIKMMIF